MKNCFLGLVLALGGLVISTGANAQARAQYEASTAIANSANNQCWDVKDYSTQDGAIIQLYPCTGSSNQSWVFQVFSYAESTSMTRIVNVNSGMCAAIENSDPTTGAIGLRQHVCNVNDPLQQFYVEAPFSNITVSTTTFPIPLLSRHIISIATHWCVVMDPSVGRPFEESSCGASNNQAARWKMSGP